MTITGNASTAAEFLIPCFRLAEDLAARPRIRPLKAVLKDSSFLFGLTGVAGSVLAVFSGFHDHLSVGLAADWNFLRVAQGVAATASVLIFGAVMSAVGRHQTYRDLADYQALVQRTPQEQWPDLQESEEFQSIVRRAEPAKGWLGRQWNRAMANNHNIIAAISLPLCAVMAASGIASGRPGEALSAALIIPAYLARLMPERYGPVVPGNAQGHENRGQLRRAFDRAVSRFATFDAKRVFNESRLGRAAQTLIGQPLLLSALLMSWRVVPLGTNAIATADPYQTAQFALWIAISAFLADTTKGGVGRGNGPILLHENGTDIARSTLDGRLLKRDTLKSLQFWRKDPAGDHIPS